MRREFISQKLDPLRRVTLLQPFIHGKKLTLLGAGNPTWHVYETGKDNRRVTPLEWFICC